MELAVRLTAEPLPGAGDGPSGAGLVVAAVCAAVLLGIGLAHYAGAFKQATEVWLLSPYTVLALAWLGGGGLLVVAGMALGDAAGGLASGVGVVLAVLGLAAWVVGLVGLVWLPPRLRPRWLRERLADPEFVRARRLAAPDGAPMSPPTSPQQDPTTVTAGGVRLPLPDGWEQVDAPGATLAVAGPPGAATASGVTFRPSVTVMVVPVVPDADVRVLGTEAIVAAQAVGGHVLAYDVWPTSHGHARRLTFAVQHGEVPASVTQWVGVRDGSATTVTATFAVTQAVRLAPVGDWLAGSALDPQEER